MKYSFGVRVGLILIALLVIGVSVFLIINREGSEESYENSIVPTTSIISQTNRDLRNDPDNDGLENWQEALWGTDKNNADTDGDGVSDGQEILDNTNPNTPNNNPFSTTESTRSTTTATAQLSKDLLGQYLVLKDNNQTINPAVEADIVASILSSDYLTVPTERHTTEDITINNTISLEKYAETMGLLFIGTSGRGAAENELDILTEYGLTENIEVLKKLEGPLERYKNLRDTLIKTSVPARTATIHLALLNNIESVRSGLVAISRLGEDAILGVAGLSLYQEGSIGILTTLQSAQELYSSEEIVFEENEAGYIFLYGL